MQQKHVFSKSLLGLFNFGHFKNVQNRFLESLSHAEILEFLIILEFPKEFLDLIINRILVIIYWVVYWISIIIITKV